MTVPWGLVSAHEIHFSHQSRKTAEARSSSLTRFTLTRLLDAITARIYDRRKWGSGVRLHGSNPELRMSALGQKRTLERVQSMSALPPKADIAARPFAMATNSTTFAASRPHTSAETKSLS